MTFEYLDTDKKTWNKEHGNYESPVVFVAMADSITAADVLFEAHVGKNPAKMRNIVVQVES